NDGQTHCFRGAAYQSLVSKTARTPELVIQMSHRQLPTVFRRERGQDMEQCHRVNTARHCDKEPLTRHEKPMPFYRKADLFLQMESETYATQSVLPGKAMVGQRVLRVSISRHSVGPLA